MADSAECGLHPEDAVEHPLHGHGVVVSVSKWGGYAVVRYSDGHRRAHPPRKLTRVTSPAERRA